MDHRNGSDRHGWFSQWNLHGAMGISQPWPWWSWPWRYHGISWLGNLSICSFQYPKTSPKKNIHLTMALWLYGPWMSMGVHGFQPLNRCWRSHWKGIRNLLHEIFFHSFSIGEISPDHDDFLAMKFAPVFWDGIFIMRKKKAKRLDTGAPHFPESPQKSTQQIYKLWASYASRTESI